MIDVRFCRGVEVAGAGFWLDPHDAQPFAFVSHAHSDHLGRHAEIVTSAGTAQLMRARLGGERIEHVLEFGETRHLRGFDLTLLPAGHIFGSAQCFLQNDAGSLLYTGDFKLRPGRSAEPAQWCQAETLIMETTYGLPRYVMPPTDQVLGEMINFCQEALEDDAVPVLLGYSLGKAQEILCALVAAGLTPMLHGAVHKMTEIYRHLKPGFPSEYLLYDSAQTQGKVLICPPHAANSVMLRRIAHRRVAVLTGWALDAGAHFRYRCDAAFPLTDHADYPDLIRYVELVQPRRVLTLHGFAAEFARDLRERGLEAWALSEENQLELTLPGARVVNTPFRPAASIPLHSPTPPGSFLSLAELGQELASVGSRTKKILLLSHFFRTLDAASLPIAAVYFTGRAFAQGAARPLQVGWAVIKRALRAVTGIDEGRFREISRRHADAGKTAYEVLLPRADTSGPFSLVDSQDFFEQLETARGPLAKGQLLRDLLERIGPLEGSYVVRILTGDLRIGLKEGLIEEALALGFQSTPEAIREAHMLTGNLGQVAQLAARQALDEVSLELFRPIKCMLASPEPNAEAIWSRLSNEAFWLEDKFDGIRAQIHIGAGRVEIFSRDLRRITGQFADLADRAQSFTTSGIILDGEILAFDPTRKLTFFDLQRRLGRKMEDDLFLGRSDVPVIFQSFDLLWQDGQSLLREPLSARRARLETLILPEGFPIAPRITAESAAEIDAAFEQARGRNHEGLIAKAASSLYSPGRRAAFWLKLKKELATLDVVVVGAEGGHGKRSHVLSDYTFAVRDDATGALLTIGKAYSGLTDREIEDLTEHFQATTLAQHGRYREVAPQIILEIAFDSVQPSDRHASGLALRFPRIKTIRRDKTLAEIDTLSTARALCQPA